MKKIYLTLTVIIASLTFSFSQSNKESPTSPTDFAAQKTALYTHELDLNGYQEIEVFDLIEERNQRDIEIKATTEEGSEERKAQTEYEDRKFMTGMAETLSDDQYDKWKRVRGNKMH